MRFILETITGRKGIKNFSSLEEYVDFMTKNGDKIKNIVESDLPYDDKPVSVATPSQSNGWEQVNKATFGDVIKKAEKGDCVLPHKASSVFKDEAKFEPSKSSEKADTSSEPKVDSTPVKNNNEGSEKDLPKFEYKDETKSSSETSEKSEPKEEKKDSENKDDKKEIKESFEDDYEDEDEDEDDVYKEKCMNIVNMLPTQDENKAAKILDKWVQKGDITQDEYDYIMSNWDYFFEPLEEGFKDIFNKGNSNINDVRRDLIHLIIVLVVINCIAWEIDCLFLDACYGENIEMELWISHTLCPLIFASLIFLRY